MEKGRINMKLRSARILQEGKREIRAIGDSCDPSCFVWFACGNSKPNDVCKGFVLLNGETRRIINKNLSENDALYVNACVRMVQNNECKPEEKDGLVEEILRYIPPPKTPPSGFSAMVEASRGIERSREEEKQEEPSNSGFQRMLEASGKSEQPHTATLTRGIDESQFPDVCDPTKCPPNYARHCRANREEHWGKACVYKTPKNR
jgi:hypothetical protein